MGKKTKTGGRGRLDKYYHLAKEQGYRSRAAFKLIQLNRKYDFLGNAKALLDLCAAPGGWMQVAAKTMPVASLIIGVDLVPIKPVRGTRTILGDITTQECRAKIKKEAAGSMMDVVVHDGAPNVGGAWSSEAYTQSALVLDSLKLATEFLAPKGVFVTKIFRSQDYNALLYAMQQLFEKVEPTKPAASRNTSAEIFVVCTGYKAPAKIDPKLLDAKFLFQEVVEAKRPMGPEALFKQQVSQKRHRDGYEEGVSSLHRVASALSFVAAERPVEMLGTFTRLELEGAGSWVAEGVADAKELAHKIRSDATTTPEIAALCKDLQVLGRSEFKQLLKWRLGLRKAMKEELGPVGGLMGGAVPKSKKAAAEASKPKAGGDADDEEEGDADDPEAKLLSEMREVQARMAADVKRDKKKRHEMKVKSRVRSAQMAASEGIVGDATVADGLFTLGVLKGKDSRARVVDVSAPGEADLDILEAPSGSDEEDQTEVDRDDEDEDDADLRYEAEMEAGLEESYRSYMERQGHRKAAAKEKRMRLGKEGELDANAAEAAADDKGGNGGGDDDDDIGLAGSSEDEESDEEDEEAGDGLLVSLDKSRVGVAKTGAAMAAQWFRQDVFDDPDLVEDERPTARKPHDGEAAAAAGLGASTAGRSKTGAPPKQPAGSATAAAAEEDEEDGPSASNSDEEEEDDDEAGPSGRLSGLGFDIVPVGPAAAGGGRGGSKAGGGAAGPSGSDDDPDSETDSEDEFDMLDDHGKAEVLALAKRMLRRREKESIIDAAYNRFAFHDTHLPKWFADDERRHMRPIAQVTKEEVDEEKERLRAIDARPIKKVAEAKARRRKIAQGKLQQARQKANAVVDNDDVAGRSKQREIEKIYAKARSSISNQRGGKGGKKSRGSGKPLDARMRKDMRATKSIAKANKGKKGRGSSGSGGRGGRGGKGGKKGAASNRKNRD